MDVSVYDVKTMRALYPNPITLPSLLALALLCGCEQAELTSNGTTETEPWPNEHEAVFQEAEALKYSLQQQEIEAQRLHEAGLPDTPAAPLQ